MPAKDWGRSFLASLAVHGTVIALLLLAGLGPSILHRDSSRETASIVREALERSAAHGAVDSSVKSIVESLAYDFDADLGTEQRIAIVKTLVDRVSAYLQKNPGANAGEISLSEILTGSEIDEGLPLDSGERAFVGGLRRGDPTVHVDGASGGEIKALTRADSNQDVERSLISVHRGLVHVEVAGGGYGDSWINKHAYPGIPESYYFRDSPYDRIVASLPNLFTCFAGFPPVSGGSASGEEEAPNAVSDRPHDPAAANDRLNMVFVSLRTGLVKPGKPAKSVLRLDGSARRAVLDDLMPLSERRQYARLKKDYLDRYAADSPSLAELADEFFENNLNGVFFDVHPVSTAFDQLEELYFKKGIYDDLPAYWGRNAGTLTGGILLLYLAAAYDFEARTIGKLKAAYPAARDMYVKAFVPNNIYNSRRKALVVKLGYEKIKEAAEALGKGGVDAVLARYREARRRIFRLLIESGGTNRNRGLFSLGRLLWEEGDFDGAIEQWKKIAEDYPGPGFQPIRRILRESLDRPARIEQIRKAFVSLEMGGDDGRQVERLARFSRWKARLEDRDRFLD